MTDPYAEMERREGVDTAMPPPKAAKPLDELRDKLHAKANEWEIRAANLREKSDGKDVLWERALTYETCIEEISILAMEALAAHAEAAPRKSVRFDPELPWRE